MDFDHREFRELVRTLECARTVALTGAGCSTESGIPDYRGPETARRARNPITFQQYLRHPDMQRRYWARSAVGWPTIRRAQPNDGHRALAALEQAGTLGGVITQNVDRLHHAAGSRRVVELHGALADVVCLDCGALDARDAVQARMLADNPQIEIERAALAPDGDADVEPDLQRFVVPTCTVCAGRLKPRVVFFGENVPREVVDDAWALLDEAEALLVVGSSLTVYSGLRFVKRAAERRLPIAIVNVGPTRADELAWVRLDARAGAVLPALADALAGR